MVKKAVSLNSIDELSLSEATKNYLFRKFSSVDGIIKKGREIAFERRNSALVGRWERELVSALDSAGFIRPANDFVMTFNVMRLYAEVYPEFRDSFATNIKQLSNEGYESFIGLTDHEIKVLKNLLSNRLDSRDQAIVYRRFGLEDGEVKTLEAIGKELFVSTYKIREALARCFRFLRRGNILPPIGSAPESANETAKELADELEELRRDPIFKKERSLVSELQSFLKATPFRYSREFYEVAGLELSLYDTPIEKLELSLRSNNCLKRAMLFTIDDLLRMSPKDLMKVRNLGRKGVEEVLEALRPYRS